MLLRKKRPSKVCVVGNSHITAFKRFWDTDPHPKTWSPTFFGTSSIALQGLRVEGETLTPPSKASIASFERTSGGMPKIDCTQFDEFYLHGMISGAALAKMIFEIDTSSERGMPLSSAFIEEIVTSFYEESLLKLVSLKLRTATRKPIFVSSGPLPSANYQRSREGYKTNPDRLGIYADILDQVETTFERLFATQKIQYLKFPKSSVASGLYNDHTYMVGSHALDGGTAKDHPQHDLIHANDKYGALLFKRYVEARE